MLSSTSITKGWWLHVSLLDLHVMMMTTTLTSNCENKMLTHSILEYRLQYSYCILLLGRRHWYQNRLQSEIQNVWKADFTRLHGIRRCDSWLHDPFTRGGTEGGTQIEYLHSRTSKLFLDMDMLMILFILLYTNLFITSLLLSYL